MIRIKNLLLEMDNKISIQQSEFLFQSYFSQITSLYFSPLQDQFYSKMKEWYEILLSLDIQLSIESLQPSSKSYQHEEEIGRFIGICGYFIYCLNQTKEKDHWVVLTNQLLDQILSANELVLISCVHLFHLFFISSLSQSNSFFNLFLPLYIINTHILPLAHLSKLHFILPIS